MSDAPGHITMIRYLGSLAILLSFSAVTAEQESTHEKSETKWRQPAYEQLLSRYSVSEKPSTHKTTQRYRAYDVRTEDKFFVNGKWLHPNYARIKKKDAQLAKRKASRENGLISVAKLGGTLTAT